jgi:hypothetical protein
MSLKQERLYYRIDYRCNSKKKKWDYSINGGWVKKERWVNTADDSVFIQNNPTNDNERFRGTLHPNLWGHAALADFIYPYLERQLCADNQ